MKILDEMDKWKGARKTKIYLFDMNESVYIIYIKYIYK